MYTSCQCKIHTHPVLNHTWPSEKCPKRHLSHFEVQQKIQEALYFQKIPAVVHREVNGIHYYAWRVSNKQNLFKQQHFATCIFYSREWYVGVKVLRPTRNALMSTTLLQKFPCFETHSWQAQGSCEAYNYHGGITDSKLKHKLFAIFITIVIE